MFARSRKAGWQLTYQATVAVALLLFPLALALDKVGIPLATGIERVVDRVNTAYKARF